MGRPRFPAEPQRPDLCYKQRSHDRRGALLSGETPNGPRLTVMPTGLAVGLEPPCAPGAAGTARPKDRDQSTRLWTNGRDWFPRCSGPRVRRTRL